MMKQLQFIGLLSWNNRPAVVFACCAFPALLFLSVYTPAFQVPDEVHHFMRAYQVYQGEFFPMKELRGDGNWSVGGMVDKNIMPLDTVYHELKFFSQNKVTSQAQQRASGLDWSGDVFTDTRNVSIYPPFLYMPTSLGIALAKGLGLNIENTLIFCRILQSLCVLGLSFVGLCLSIKGQWWLCLVLLLPMSLGQMASVSQDGFLISLAVLSVALLGRVIDSGSSKKTPHMIYFSALCLWLLATARPPYIALALSFLVVAREHKDIRHVFRAALSSFLLVCGGALLWFWHLSQNVFLKDQRIEGVSYEANIGFILFQPIEWLGFLLRSIVAQWSYYFKTFVGNLGHHDTPFPDLYYMAAFIALCLAGGLTAGTQRSLSTNAWAWLTIVFLTILGIFMALFITWTPLHYPYLHGVQGRYFIPVAFFIGLIGAKNHGVLPQALSLWGVRWIKGFALGTLMLTPYVVYVRYYG